MESNKEEISTHFDPQELWDKYSMHIDDDVFSLSLIADTCVITERDYTNLAKEFQQRIKVFEDKIKSITPIKDNVSDGWISWNDYPTAGYYIVYDPNGYVVKIEVARFDPYNNSWFIGSDCIHPTHYRVLPSPPKQ
jgi:hypothetical protein